MRSTRPYRDLVVVVSVLPRVWVYFLEKSLEFGKSGSHISKNVINTTLSRNHRALGRVCFDDRFGVLVEGNKPLRHSIIGNFKVENVLARSNGLFKLFSLSNLTRISVNQESLRAGEFLDHRLSKKIKDS